MVARFGTQKRKERLRPHPRAPDPRASCSVLSFLSCCVCRVSPNDAPPRSCSADSKAGRVGSAQNTFTGDQGLLEIRRTYRSPEPWT